MKRYLLASMEASSRVDWSLPARQPRRASVVSLAALGFLTAEDGQTCLVSVNIEGSTGSRWSVRYNLLHGSTGR